MKYLFLILLSFNSFASSIPVSEAQRYIDALPNGVPPLYSCSDKPEEECLDVSHISAWEAAEIVEIDGKKSVVMSETKLAIIKEREEAQKAKEDKKKNFSFKGNTIAALRNELNEWLEMQR